MTQTNHISRRQQSISIINQIFDDIEQENLDDGGHPIHQSTFTNFCRIAEILSPEIQSYLEEDALDAIGVPLPAQLAGTTLKQAPAPRLHKVFVGQVIGRLLLGLKDAIGDIFPGGKATVGAIISDLRSPQRPSRILPDQRPGDQSHAFTSEKGAAQIKVFEIIIFEQARRGLRRQMEAADLIFGEDSISERTLQRFRKAFKESDYVTDKNVEKFVKKDGSPTSRTGCWSTMERTFENS